MAQWETPCCGTSKNDRLHLPLLFVWVSIGCSVCLSVCLSVSISLQIYLCRFVLFSVHFSCLSTCLSEFFLYGFYNPTKGPVTLYPLEGGGRVVVSR